MNQDETRASEPEEYGDIRDHLPLMFGVSVLSIPLLVTGIAGKIVELSSRVPNPGYECLIGMGLIGVILGTVAEFQRRKYLHHK